MTTTPKSCICDLYHLDRRGECPCPLHCRGPEALSRTQEWEGRFDVQFGVAPLQRRIKKFMRLEMSAARKRERERVAAWLEDEKVQFPQNPNGFWDKTIEAFKRAAWALRHYMTDDRPPYNV